MIFYRADHSTLVIKLNSDEPLGILDTDYIEDYNGADGQLTVYSVDTTNETPLVMIPLPAETPGTANDVFHGSLLLASLLDGDYQIRGRVRDLVGNYTVIGAFANPDGNETIMPFDFTIAEGAFIPFPGRTATMPRLTRISTIDAVRRAFIINHNRRVFQV